MSSTVKSKRYPIQASPLFRIRGKGQFERVIGIAWNSVPELLLSVGYRVWLNEKKREIQAPVNSMALIHTRVGNLLSRVELPDYLYSQKGRSYVDNARQHLGRRFLIKTDIQKFYPSTTRSMVFRMFLHDFECAEDVAHRLADICCYKQEHLPTGSPLSGRIAFFAARQMFDEVANISSEANCKLSVFVDDITISGDAATKSLLGEVRKVVRIHGLKTKLSKSKTYAPTSPKLVTGVIVVSDRLLLPNIRHLKIWQTKKAVQNSRGVERDILRRQLTGRLKEAEQILGPESGGGSLSTKTG